MCARCALVGCRGEARVCGVLVVCFRVLRARWLGSVVGLGVWVVCVGWWLGGEFWVERLGTVCGWGVVVVCCAVWSVRVCLACMCGAF